MIIRCPRRRNATRVPVDVQAGTLDFAGGSTSTHTAATITVAIGALLDFSSGTHTLDVDTTYETPEGLFSGATVNLDGTYTLTGSSTTISDGQFYRQHYQWHGRRSDHQ